MNYMQLFLGDIVRDTMHLSAEEFGAYMRLLISYHARETAVPSDDDRLRNITGVPMERWARTRGALQPFFTTENGSWINKRAEEEIVKYRNIAKEQSEKGKLGAQKRWGDKPNNDRNTADPIAPAIADAMAHAMPEAMPGGIPKNSPPSPSPSPDPTPAPIGTHTHKGSGELPLSPGEGRTRPYARPTIDEARLVAAKTGLSEKDADDFWNYYESTGWLDRNGNIVVNWQSKMALWRSKSQAKANEDAIGKDSQGLSRANQTTLSKEHDRVIEAIRRLKDNAALDAVGRRYYTPQDKEKLKQLVSRRDELKKQLGIKY